MVFVLLMLYKSLKICYKFSIDCEKTVEKTLIVLDELLKFQIDLINQRVAFLL